MDNLFIILLCIIMFILVPIYIFFSESFTYWERKKIPHLPAQSIYGNFFNIGQTKHLSQLLQVIYQKFKGISPFAGIYYYTKPDIVVIDLKLVKNILIKDFTYFQNRGLYYNEKDDPLSANLITFDGPKWTGLRHKLAPSFSALKMKYLFPTVVSVADEFQQCLSNLLMLIMILAMGDNKTNDHTVDLDEELEISECLERFTTDIIGRCVYGLTECASINDLDSEFVRMGKEIFNKQSSFVEDAYAALHNRIFRSVFHLDRYDRNVTNYFENIAKETIENRKNQILHPSDYMDLLIQIKNSDEKHKFIQYKLSTNQMASQAFVFFLAGFEPMNSVLSFTFYELSLNLDIQNMARQEIKNVLKKYDDKLTYDAMKEMKYIDQILLESIRKYPPIVTIMRKVERNYHIADKNITLEKNSMVMIPVYAIHHDPEYYPDPEKFDPDRFTQENIAKRPDMSFLGYGDGPRNCIGRNFGQMIIKVGLITLLKNFGITPGLKTPKPPLKFSPRHVVLAPNGGLWLKFKKIENNNF